MTARWTKVNAYHKIEGTRAEWILELDGDPPFRVARIWRENDAWHYCASLQAESATGAVRWINFAAMACTSVLPEDSRITGWPS